MFSRRPVQVPAAVADRSIAALAEARRAVGNTPSRVEKELAGLLVAQIWPYVVRLVEDNVVPGRELHPAMRPLYEVFADLAEWAAPGDPQGRYANWLTGGASDRPEPFRQRYMARWSESRRRVQEK